MKKYYLLIFIALICGVIYLVKSKRIDSTEISMSGTKDSMPHGPVNRVISLCKHPIPIILLGLDASDRRLVGVHPDAKVSMRSNVLNNYFPDFQNLSGNVCSKAFVPNIEEMVKLKPDLVLQWSMFPETIAQMEGFGFKVVGVQYDGSDQNDRDMVNLVARAIGREEKADSIMHSRDSTIRKIRAVREKIPQEKKLKVIFFYNYDNLRVGGEKCYENFCINLVGGQNMGAGLGIDRSVNIEQILEWDPDIILFGGWRKSINPADIYQNPILADVSAVRNRRVIKMPIWASNESELIWKWMAEIIQPDYFDYNIREEIKASYSWHYKINLSEADVDQVLFYEVNAASSLYNNFKRKM